jgi:hypothetical protein
VTGSSIDGDKATRRCLRRVCLRNAGRGGSSAIHEGHIGRTRWADGRRRARGRSSIKDGLFATLESVIELSCACGHWMLLVSRTFDLQRT